MSKCKRSCCWSPWQVCARQRECACHTSDQQVRDKITPDELQRAQAVFTQKGYGR